MVWGCSPPGAGGYIHFHRTFMAILAWFSHGSCAYTIWLDCTAANHRLTVQCTWVCGLDVIIFIVSATAKGLKPLKPSWIRDPLLQIIIPAYHLALIINNETSMWGVCLWLAKNLIKLAIIAWLLHSSATSCRTCCIISMIDPSFKLLGYLLQAELSSGESGICHNSLQGEKITP